MIPVAKDAGIVTFEKFGYKCNRKPGKKTTDKCIWLRTLLQMEIQFSLGHGLSLRVTQPRKCKTYNFGDTDFFTENLNSIEAVISLASLILVFI